MGQEVSYNKIRDGVISALHSILPEAEVYGEEMLQNLTPPCFFVKLLKGEQSQELGRRYNRNHLFDIHFFAEGDKNRAIHDMAEKLYDKLELIEIEGVPYRGANMYHEIVDRVLHFFVEYNFNVYREKPAVPVMEAMEQEGGVKP